MVMMNSERIGCPEICNNDIECRKVHETILRWRHEKEEKNLIYYTRDFSN
jgi:hypothetical protein